MERKDWAVVGLNVALAVGLCALLGLGRVTWDQFIVGLGLLAAPSALAKRSTGDAGK
jgi:hypothetical protein